MTSEGPNTLGCSRPSSPRSPRGSGREGTRLRVLGIETSCDETAVAVVEDGLKIMSNVLSSQHEIHGRFGGVVPELASRAHVERLNPLLDVALAEAGIRWSEVDAVAVTRGPGLVGALLVGLATAKAIALALDAPLIAVNHLEGHVYANFLEHGPPEPPYVCLLVSGGHTMLVHMTDLHRFELLGQTVDDAAGEAFDKVARFLGLGYPGGPVLDELADLQVSKTIEAARSTGVGRVLMGGGVVANSRLRERMQRAADEAGIELRY